MEEKPRTRRDRYKIEPTQKTRVEKATDEIVKRTLEVLCKEDVFPKRSRWLMAYKIADLINDFHSFVQIANEIEVRSHAEFVERHKYQTLAIALLKASDVKMTLAVDVMKASANKLEFWAGQYNDTLRQLQGWRNKDEKRYAEKYGSLTEDDKTQIERNIPIL